MKKVSADTITELTIAAAPSAGAGGAPPTAQEMIDTIRAQLTLRVQYLAKSMQRAREKGQPKNNGTTAFKISHGKAVKELQKFESLVAHVPNGFRLTPVLYSTLEQGQNDRIRRQYLSHVRPEFMRYLANNHAQELGALGICPQGIDRMKKGLDPVDPSGRLYNVNVDHIIERFGGGKVSTTQEVDPLMPPGSKPTYLVNHFNNIILLPIKIHDIKNALNELQDAAKTPHGQSKWVLMLVPETGPGHAGYVARPQGQLQTRAANMNVQRMSALRLAESTAYQVDNILEGIAQSPAQKELVKPALKDLSGKLTTAFNDASKPRQDMKAFVRFYEGKNFTSLRRKVDALPVEERSQLRNTLHWIDLSLEERFNRQAVRKPANNNKKPAPVQKAIKEVTQQTPHVPHRKKQKKRGHKRR